MDEPKTRKASIHAIAMSLAKAGVPFRITQGRDGTTTLETGVTATPATEPNPWDSLLTHSEEDPLLRLMKGRFTKKPGARKR